jgi:hypothetical protein
MATFTFIISRGDRSAPLSRYMKSESAGWNKLGYSRGIYASRPVEEIEWVGCWVAIGSLGVFKGSL